MDLVANALLAAGASPAMVHAAEEVPPRCVEDFQRHAAALSVNIGTLSAAWLPGMLAAARAAREQSRPWVLDPVAAGATAFRSQACVELVQLGPAVIRGNASEVLALAAAVGAIVEGGLPTTSSKGVDSAHGSADALVAAKALAVASATVVAVSGATDFVTDGRRVLAVNNGVALLQRVTATGCAVSALIAAFLAVLPSKPVDAAAYALSIFGLAAEIAMERGGHAGPGSLRLHLLDALHSLDSDAVLLGSRIAEVKS
eukprot:SM000028S10043  [mRNA]  locus=s28:50619:52051:- [translate_table: standard]